MPEDSTLTAIFLPCGKIICTGVCPEKSLKHQTPWARKTPPKNRVANGPIPDFSGDQGKIKIMFGESVTLINLSQK